MLKGESLEGEIRINDPQQMEEIFQQAVVTPKVPVRISAVSLDSLSQEVLRTRVEADASADMRGADVYLAIAIDHVESQVLRGENGGRRLSHVAVVLQLAKIGKLQKRTTFANDVQLKLKPGTDPKNLRLVAFVQSSGPGKLLGATLWKALPGKTRSDISARRTPSSPRSRLLARMRIMSALAVFRSIRLT